MPLLTIAMADVPASDAGLGSGIVNVSQQVSGALGLAVLGTLATNRTQALEAHGHALAARCIGGYHLAFVVGAACLAVGIVTALRGAAPDYARAAASPAAGKSAGAAPAAAGPGPPAKLEAT